MAIFSKLPLSEYFPTNLKLITSVVQNTSFQGVTHKLCVPLSPSTDSMISILLNQVFHLDINKFLYVFDFIGDLQNLLISIPVCKRNSLLYTLTKLSCDVSHFEYFQFYFQYLLDSVTIIDYILLKNSARTLRNILHKNQKIINIFLDHDFAYRPLEVVEEGKEQMFRLPGASTLDNLNTCFSSIEDTAVGIQSAIEESTAVLRSLAPRVANASDSVSGINTLIPHMIETLDAITKFTTAGHETLGKLDKHATSLVSIDSFAARIKRSWPAIIACSTGIMTSTSIVQLLTHVVPLLSLLGLDTTFVSYISDFFTTRAKEQDGFDNTKKLMCFLASFLGKYSPITFISKMSSNMNSTVREMESMDKLIDMFGDVLSEFGFDVTSKAKAISQLRTDMIELIEKTPHFEALVSTKCVAFVRDAKYKEFMECYTKIQLVKKQVDTGVYMSIRNSNFCSDLMNFNTRYIRMKAAIDMVRATNGRRQEPVAILFHGPPKLGKSQLMCHIKSRISQIYSEKYADNDNYLFMDDFSDWTTWQQNTTDDYHQGYNGQEIHAIDDLFSRVDHLDHKDMLNFISCVVFPTRQADIADKGKPYNAKLMIASSNIWPSASTQINCIDALHRRFTVIRFNLKSGKTVPSTGFDTSFDWLDLEGFAGEHYHGAHTVQRTAKGKRAPALLSVDDICVHIIEAMRIKHDIFQAGLAAAEIEEEEYLSIPRIITRSIPVELTPVYLESDWSGSCAKYRQNKDVFRFLRTIKFRNPCMPSDESTYFVSDLAAVNNLFHDTKTVLYCLSTSVHRPEAYALIVRDIDGSYVYYNTLTQTIDRTHDDFSIHYEYVAPTPEQDWDDFSFLEKVSIKFVEYYGKVYASFSPLIKVCSALGCYVRGFMNPLATYASVFVSLALTYLRKHEYVGDLLCMVWETVNDIMNIAYLIPALIGIGGFIIYKCKSFTMTEACRNCSLSVQNFDEMHKQFCKMHCHYMRVGDHSDVCSDFPQFGSFFLRNLCVACKNGVCEGACSHSLPIESVDYKKLALFRNWFEENVDFGDINDPVVVESPNVKRYFEESVKLSFKEEESPKGERQAKIKRTFRQEESPKGERQAKIKRTFRSESNDWRQLKPWIKSAPLSEEESPKGERMTKVKRSMKLEENTFRKPTSVDVSSWLETPEEMLEEYEFGGHNPGSTKTDKIKVSLVSSGAEQQSLDEGSRNLYAAVVKNTVLCKRKSSSGKMSSLFGHPFGKNIVTPAHLHNSADPTTTYSFITYFNGVELEVPMTLVNKKDSRDVALWAFSHKSVLFNQRFYNNLITDDEFLKYANQELYVLQHLPKMDLTQLVVASTVNHKQIMLQGKGLKEYEKLLQVQATMTHSPVTTDGDCGGVLVVFNTLVHKKIIGFHVVGSTDRAYSAIVTKDLIDSLFPPAQEELSFDVIDQTFSRFPLVDICGQVNTVASPSRNLPYGEFEYLGELDYLARPAATTGIKKHPLFGSFETRHGPANLTTASVLDQDSLLIDRLGDPNLLITRTGKYGKKFQNIMDPTILLDMETQLSAYYIEHFLNKEIGLSSEYEILNGNPLDTDSHPLDMRTSAGIPWSGTEYGHAHKKEHFIKYTQNDEAIIFREFDHQNVDTIKLFDVMRTTESLALQGYRTLSINKDCMKDECRPLDKIHKPRIFKNVPFDKVILGKKYLGKFKTEWTKMGGDMFHSVGINTLSPDWAKLYHDLKLKSDIGCDADFGTFDGNLRPEFMDIACRVIRNTLRSRNGNDDSVDRIVEILLDENVRSVSVSAYTVYMDDHGNPSGSPMTTVMNCIVNFLYHWYCFIRITNRRGLARFTDLIALRAFGDDVVYTADTAIGYTFESVSKIMINELEQDYTDATKSLSGATKPIEELSFLKRKFKVISPSIVLSPIEPASIEMRFTFTQIPPTDYTTHKELIEEGLLEAAMHGTSYFNEFATKLQRGIRKCYLSKVIRGFNPVYSDYYQDLMNRYQ